jgi:diguanylate cyclase (GGDEF)-like protein
VRTAESILTQKDMVMRRNYKLKQIQGELEKVAQIDALTGVYNRRFFMEFLENGVLKSKKLVGNCYIVMIDVDKFKSINDTYGHQAGDRVLAEVAARLKALIRKPDDIFARYGGEEFITLITDTDDDEIVEIVERLRLSVCEEMFEIDDSSLHVTASFGIARINNYDIEEAIKNADAVLYKAKDTGRNRAIFMTDIL